MFRKDRQPENLKNETNRLGQWQRFGLLAAFVLLAIVTSAGYGDYGLSTDEPMQRNHLLTQARHIFLKTGLLRYAPQAVRLAPELPTYRHRYYGIAAQYPLLLLEYFPKALNPARPLFWELRHLYSRIFFLLSALAFFFIIRRASRSPWVLFGGMLLYLSHPRIHAHSFYNIKDLMFLSFMVFSLLCLLRFFERPNWRRAVALGAVAAVTINIRVMGVLVPFFFFFWLLARIRAGQKGMLRLGCLVAAVLLLILIIVWPTLWMNPPRLFAEAFARFSDYSVWTGRTVFAGKLIQGSRPPLLYAPTWITITSPYSHLFSWGLGLLLMAYFSLWSLVHRRQRGPAVAYFSLYVVAGSYAAILFFRSTLYGSWRHLFYLFPMLCVLAVVALEHVRSLSKKTFAALLLIVSLSLAPTIGWMVSNHPHQYVYFNSLAGRDWGQRWDRDIWTLSTRQMLILLLEIDGRQGSFRIFRGRRNDGLHRGKRMLAPELQARIRFVDRLEQADYAIGNYRNVIGDYPARRFWPLRAYLHIVVDGNRIMTVFKRAESYKNKTAPARPGGRHGRPEPGGT